MNLQSHIIRPNDTHLKLIRQLPREAQKALEVHGPGWDWIERADGLFDTSLLDEQHGFDDEFIAWLPCDPCAILEVAAEMTGTALSMNCEDGLWLAMLMRAGKHAHSQTGTDPHEAALKVLLKVCEEGSP